jgi:hypothetical protein
VGVHVIARGIVSSAGSSPGTLTMRARIDSVSGTTMGATAAASLSTSQSNVDWKMEFSLIWQSLGSAAQAEVDGEFLSSALATVVNGLGGALATYDTTADHQLHITAQFGTANAANSIQLRQLILFGL